MNDIDKIREEVARIDSDLKELRLDLRELRDCFNRFMRFLGYEFQEPQAVNPIVKIKQD